MRVTEKVFFSAALPAAIICFLVYLKAVTCGFVQWDDPAFIINNTVIRNFDSHLFAWSFETIAPFSGIWIPLTWISFAVDYQLWGLNPFGYHLINIVLHSANVMVLVLIADCLCRRTFLENKTPPGLINVSLILAGVFWGIHPLRVESVAWVTERKDVLNGLFFFASILFYLKYALKSEGIPQSSAVRYYVLSLVCFLMSLMAKPVSVVLPVMLLVADWYLNRFKKQNVKAVLWEKAPFFVVALSVLIFTLYIASGKDGLLVSMTDFPLLERVIVSGNAVFQYLRFSVIPVDIVQYVPLPTPIPYTYALNLLMVVFLLFAVAKSRNRILISSTLCFLLPLIPTLALFQNNDHAYAARYTYLPAAIPSIAIVVAITLHSGNTAIKWGQVKKWFIVTSTVMILVFYALLTEKLIDVWRDTGTFWSRIIEENPMGRAYQERGMYYYGRGEYTLAIKDLTSAIEIASSLGLNDMYNLNAFRGEACRRVKKYDDAIKEFTYAISKAPRPAYFYHRGLALKALGKTEAANKDFVRAGLEVLSIDWY